MKTHMILMVALVLLTGSISAQDNKASVLLTAAIYEEEVSGNLDKAVELYLNILKKYPEDRQVCAKTLYHLGLVNEIMGKQKANEYFTRLINTYPDQIEVVALARQKLNLLTTIRPESKSNGIITREVWSPSKDDWSIAKQVSTVSPDGRYLAFIDWGEISSNVYDTKTGKEWRVSEKGTWEGNMKWPEGSIWSPDSKQIAYIWYNGHTSQLRIVNLDGSGIRILRQDHEAMGPYPTEWSQDGKYIIAILEIRDTTKVHNHEDHIVRVSVKDGSMETLISLNMLHTNQQSFSPDGQSILYDLDQEVGSDKKDIYSLSIDGRTKSIIVEHPANDWFPFWTKDGKYVMFLSDRSGIKGLWRQRVENGHPIGNATLIKGNLEDSFHPLGRTSGGSIIYETQTNTWNVYFAGIDLETGKLTSPPTKLSLRFEGGNHCPTWSPDGKYLAYLSKRKNTRFENMVFVIHNIETGVEYDLTTQIKLKRSDRFTLQWSPDNRYLIMRAREVMNEKRGIYLVDIKTGEHNMLLSFEEASGDIAFPQLSPDGKNLYYQCKLKRSLNKFDLKTEQITEIYKSDEQIFFNSLSPDGKYLAFQYLYDNPNNLWIISTKGGEPKKVGSLVKDESFEWPVWTPDSRNVVVIASKSRKVYQFPIDGSQSSILKITMKEKRHLKIHPDGNRIAFDESHGGGRQIWAIDNFLPKEETINKKK